MRDSKSTIRDLGYKRAPLGLSGTRFADCLLAARNAQTAISAGTGHVTVPAVRNYRRLS
jgi:hypothetical protein